MPTQRYFNRKTGEVEEFLSDEFRCANCGATKFEYKNNPKFLAGEVGEDQKLNRICKYCKTIIAVPREMNSVLRHRYVPFKKYHEVNEEYTKSIEDKDLDKAIHKAKVQKYCVNCKKPLESGQMKFCSRNCLQQYDKQREKIYGLGSSKKSRKKLILEKQKSASDTQQTPGRGRPKKK